MISFYDIDYILSHKGHCISYIIVYIRCNIGRPDIADVGSHRRSRRDLVSFERPPYASRPHSRNHKKVLKVAIQLLEFCCIIL